jgi:hypothetical protein
MTTTAAPLATTTPRIAPLARIGLVGGALWALLPVSWKLTNVTDVEFGTLSHAAVAASYWVFAVIAPAMVVAGLVALRRALGPAAGRVGTVGLVLSMAGVAAMSVGVGIEVASISFGGDEVALGHAMLLIGFLVHIAGSIALGVVVVRRRRDPLSRAGGLLLTLALPLGLGLGVLGSAIDPNDDTWFWAAIVLPTAIAWVFLGSSLVREHRAAAPAVR